MSPVPGDVALATAARSVTLLVAERRGDRVRGGHLLVDDEALDQLRERVAEALEDVERRDARAYWPDANLDRQAEYFDISRGEVDDSLGVLELLDAGADTQRLSADDLRGRLLFYAIVVGDRPGERVAFVSKSNPARVLGKGFFLTRLTPQSDTLTSVDTPLFLFEDRTDLVVSPERILVLNQLAFEQWFRESPAIGEHIDKWIGTIHEHLPLADDGVDRLRARAETDSRIRRLLRNISDRDHLRAVPIERIREHIREQELDEEELVRGDELVLPDNPSQLLKLLNEDLFRGGLTGVPFVSDNKEPRAYAPPSQLRSIGACCRDGQPPQPACSCHALGDAGCFEAELAVQDDRFEDHSQLCLQLHDPARRCGGATAWIEVRPVVAHVAHSTCEGCRVPCEHQVGHFWHQSA